MAGLGLGSSIRLEGAAADWLRPLPGSSRSSVRLLCFAHAGGGASSFNSWRPLLPEWVNLVRVQLPGREDRESEEPITAIRPLIEEMVPALLPAIESGAFALYGHSMGAIVAFELARELRRRGGEQPLALFISGRRAPQEPVWGPLLHEMSEEELIPKLESFGGTDQALLSRPRWLRHFLNAMRADLMVSDLYELEEGEGLPYPLHAFLGAEDVLVPRRLWSGWSEHAAGEFKREILPGQHFFSREGTRALVDRIVSTLVRLGAHDESVEELVDEAPTSRIGDSPHAFPAKGA